MQKLSIVIGLAAILAAVVLLFLWPRIFGQFATEEKALIVATLVMAALVYAALWFVLCYVVAIGMYLLGMW